MSGWRRPQGAVKMRFWSAVAETFPDATSGDLAPDVAVSLKRAMERAVRAWDDANVTTEAEE